MEEVLYDYHLTQSMTDWVEGRTQESNQPYIDAVFEKHGITQAEFDSSLVWYNAHASDLKDIYDNLKDRFTLQSQKLQLAMGENEMTTIINEGGDTTNLWKDPVIIVLRDHPLLNYEKFSVKSDTSFLPGDNFRLTGDVIMMNELPSNRDALFSVTFSVNTADGKHLGETRTISTTGNFNINIQLPKNESPQQVACHFQYQSSGDLRNFALLHNISLIRMHTHHSEEDDSISLADSIQSDSAVILPDNAAPKTKHSPRLTPEQLRIQTQDDVKKIEIRTAPAVRTPNSIGPTRRKKK